LNLLGREFSTVAGLRTETARVLEDLALVAIDLDGQPEPFQLLSEGDTWVALHDLEPDHVLYVLAQGIEPSKVRLERVRDLQPYIVRA
jgi:hypothetical protein